MGQASTKLLRIEPAKGDTLGAFAHYCPGCDSLHLLPGTWTFDGNLLAPTFSPSFRQGINCHYNLVAGLLHFHPDSTHHLKGTTVPLPDLPAEYMD